MKKNAFYLQAALLILSVVVLDSCTKFLDDKPKTSLTTGNAYQTAEDIENALTGCYNLFYASDYYQWENVMLSDVRSDNAYPGGNNEETFLDYDRFILPASNDHNFANWRALYRGIARSNILLDKIGSINDPALTEDRRNQIIGEASFLRAMHYFQLVKMYGGVPLELQSNTADPDITRKTRASEAEVYAQIVEDLDLAAKNLPDSYGSSANINKVRATKGAANALLAKVWAQRSDRDYSHVLEHCNAVISSPAGYSLLTNYADLFDGQHYMSSESILEIPFETGNWSASCWGIELYLAPEDGWQKYCVPSKDLVAAYDAAGDVVRKNANIVFWNTDGNGDPISWADENWNPCADPATSIPFNYKQKHPAGWASGDDYYLLRLADIILLKAEAQNELGSPAEAAITLNIVRSRAGLAPVSSSLSKSEMKLAILNERRLELAFEAQRWDDLMRAETATDVMLALDEYTYTCNNGVVGPAVKMDYSHCDRNHWVMPIPQLERDANPNLTQNIGY
ncbi:MAG TPA: RagB/SusD family nutrient uptake outer membrane protein [Saprospiraceae bacterium]|nr:RagB/SusD family nutrient uptake outer membrane protein [Saprospiraceae bacterium]HPI04962.1 RagB/SusD family nutrient uptake outer membrane protein [Saprospiraceae bacterium]